jgi:hypothetical protein
VRLEFADNLERLVVRQLVTSRERPINLNERLLLKTRNLAPRKFECELRKELSLLVDAEAGPFRRALNAALFVPILYG